MSESFTILIADRNRHIREFLQRELSGEGYRTQLSNDGREVLKLLTTDPPDLLILDLEMPYVNGVSILEHLQSGHKVIPVIVHAFSSAEVLDSHTRYPVAFVEKDGKNIEGLKTVVIQVLERHYPYRFSSGGKAPVLPEGR